jgi:hypothetical protein
MMQHVRHMLETTTAAGGHSQGVLQGIERPVAFIQGLAHFGFRDAATETYVHDHIPPNLEPGF